jgi:hypothetical protein
MILREVLAIFGLTYDGDGEKKAEKGLDKLKTQASDLANIFGRILGAGGLIAPFVHLTQMASDAEENLNLLNLAFGENAQKVVEWSNTAAPELQRSRFTLRELAAEFGGLLQPMVGTNEQLAEMSTNLSQMAVDLSSARNIKEVEALQALQSGLAGNIIAMKRFGVNLSQVRVQQEALRRGWGKSTKDLSQAQLATLRYSLIMKDLAFIQGDAAATAKGFANVSRGVRDALKDIGTEIGLFLLPAVESFLGTMLELLKPIRGLTVGFREWAAETSLAQAVLATLALTVAFLLLPPLLKLLITVLPLVAAMGLFVLVMDEVITTFRGGNSLISEFSEWLDRMEREGFPGVTKGLAGVIKTFNMLRDVLGAVMAIAVALFEGILSGDFTDLEQSLGAAMDGVTGLFQDIGTEIEEAAEGAVNSIKAGFKTAIAAPVRSAARSLGIPVNEGGGTLFAPGEDSGGAALRASATEGSGARVSGDKNYTFNVQQLPGESGEDFARRVAEIVDSENAIRDQEIFADLVQPAGT